jgi:SPP1 family predicted phage head-tail adaptor
MTPIGRRNRKVTILHYVDAQDDIGQPVMNWVTFKTRWGNVRTLNGIETIKGGAETSIANASIRLVYCTDITTAMRAQVGATVYEIKAVLPDDAGRQYTDLACEIVQ